MIITDPKKLSMPQQVQKNKEDIETLQEDLRDTASAVLEKATVAQLQEEARQRALADSGLENEIESIREAQAVDAVVNSAALNADNKLILVKDGTPAPGNVPLETTANANMISEAFTFNGSIYKEDGYIRIPSAVNPATTNNIIVIGYNQPPRCRSQITFDVDAILSYFPNVHQIEPRIGPSGSSGGITNGNLIFKIKPFTGIENIVFYVSFGNYSASVQPYLEFLVSQLPTGVSVVGNGINKATGTHYIAFRVLANSDPIIFHAHVQDAIAYFYIDVER